MVHSTEMVREDMRRTQQIGNQWMSRTRYETVDDEPEGYLRVNLIGDGAYGKVFLGLSNDGKRVAIKSIRAPRNEEGLPVSMLREIGILKMINQFNHPNIIKLLDVCTDRKLSRKNIFLIFEHAQQDLQAYMSNVPSIHPVKVKNIIHQVLVGIDFLHSHRIVHRDLKPTNILICSNGAVKLCDFGLAKTYDFLMRLTTVVVTLWYRSPEILLGSNYATPLDIWSVACIMAELYQKRVLFRGNSEGNQLDAIFKILGTPMYSDWPEDTSISWTTFNSYHPLNIRSVLPCACVLGKDLIMKMLTFNQHARITAEEALRHAYFQDSTYLCYRTSDFGTTGI